MPKILVIDDEEIFRQTTAACLQRKGYETHEAGGGRAGVELARSVLPDLVICDVRMADMDGYATLDRLRQEPLTATIPFILMTGMGDEAGMRRGMAQGADDYLHKPFTAAELFSAISARLAKQRALQQSAEKKLTELRANLSLSLPHEMVTPLNGIFGLASILSTDAEALAPADVADMGRGILQSAERLHRLVQNFLLYGRLEMLAADPTAAGELRGQETPNLRELVESRVRTEAERAGRTADVALDLVEGGVAVSFEMMTRLVEELAGNAFKFSGPGTPVRVRAARAGETMVLSFSDQGVGMTPEQIAGIGAYSQFERKKREQQGSGLGLAIAMRLVELHGGSLKIESQPGAGATFTVALPAL